jgi:hypothetical protein
VNRSQILAHSFQPTIKQKDYIMDNEKIRRELTKIAKALAILESRLQEFIHLVEIELKKKKES